MRSLSKLSIDKYVLLVEVTEFRVDYGYERIDKLGKSYVSKTRPTSVRGSFSVDSVHNSVLSLQKCFNQSFHNLTVGMPILDYGGNKYELFVTSADWDCDPMLDDFGDIVSQYLHYRCGFQARNSPEPEKVCNIIWDAGTNEPFNITDLEDLIGDNLEDVATYALSLIDKYRFYTANIECPTPSSKDGATLADDLAAVLSGTKPATVIEEGALGRYPVIPFMICEANARGMSMQTVPNFSNTKSLVVGVDYNVREISEIMQRAVQNKEVNAYYYERLGDLLGLPQQSVDDFISNLKDFGFNRT